MSYTSIYPVIYHLPMLSVCQRKRHFWRLDTKSLTLFQNESGAKFYKVRELPCPALVSAAGPNKAATDWRETETGGRQRLEGDCR